MPPPILSFSSSFGPSASKKLSLFSVSCARVEAEESRGERQENCADGAYVAVCVWWLKGSIHGQSLLLSCTHSVTRLQISLKSAIWSGTVQHHPPASQYDRVLYVCNPVCTAERFWTYKDNAKFSS